MLLKVGSQSQCLTFSRSPFTFKEKGLGLVVHLAVDDLQAIASDEKVAALLRWFFSSVEPRYTLWS